MMFLGFLGGTEARWLWWEAEWGTWDADGVRRVLSGRRGRNRFPGEATHRWNVHTMNKEKEWARYFYVDMTKSHRTKGKKEKQNQVAEWRIVRRHHTNNYVYGYTGTYMSQQKQHVRSLPAQRWRPSAKGRAGTRDSARAVDTASLWEESVGIPLLLFHLLLCVNFFSNENLLFNLSGKHKMAKTRRRILLKVVGSIRRASVQERIQHSSWC